ncbi:hypothetical protein HJC23_005756 [Cyclotella cryptica]|uniref:Uncharacterized protein n=1 Tax=Cyclotella cryptica TaxID=29204 RepID=A0ABD3QKE5_9STRA|eukprot:CCRYP_006486-RA/>CCRYP_006486-RA protein AED:0.00 eAED:0.00 QI:166/1/1/1/1/1/2/446/403
MTIDTTMASIEHTADEAGGEAIFSSDGLPSLSAPIPPPLPPLPPNEGGDAVIQETSDPAVAFETFVMKRNDEGGGWGVLSSSADRLQREEEDRFMTMEDPRRRLLRLKAEMEELEVEWAKQQSSSEKPDKSDNNADDDEFQILSRELKSRLESMGFGDDSTSSLAAMLRGRQADLSSVISRDLEKFAAKSTDDTENITHREGEEKGKIIYELYRSSGDKLTASHREASLEERLRHLEMAVGADGVGGDNRSLVEQVEEAMRLAKEVDAKEVEKLAAKAKVIRSDLEAAARAKAKLSSSSNNPTLSPQDAQTITSLHNQLIELEGISSHLPALTTRLAELATLHSNAAEFGIRLDAAETTLNRSEAMLSHLEEVVSRVERGWVENMERVERNVKFLDDMVAGKK